MPSILFNIPSMITQSKLRIHNNALTTATERLATGSRINSAKDDPFRNNESKNVNAEIRSVERAKQNSLDGGSLLQIAEGTCGEVQNILLRIKELSVQGANDTLTSTERRYLNIETEELLKEIDRISAGSLFNSKELFGKNKDSFSEDGRGINEWNPFSGDINGRYGVLHIGSGMTSGTDEVKVSLPELSSEFLGIKNLNLESQGGSTLAMDNIDTAINSLSSVRSYLGSLVNRMDRQADDLESKNINLNDYESKIRDTDFAKEATALTTAQVQQQAAISILAQSNSRVSRVLEILGR